MIWFRSFERRSIPLGLGTLIKEKVVLLGAFLNLNDKKKLMKRINDALQIYKTTVEA